MNYEILKTYKKHFSLLGLMYFLGALIIIGVQVAVSMLVLAFAPSLLDNPNLSLLVSMLPTYTIAFPLTSLLIHQVPGVQMKKHNMKPTQLLGAFAISYALMYLSNLAGQFFTNIIGIIKGSPVDDAIADLVSELNPLTAFFVMVLLAPALEEWIFRKLLVDRTIRYGGRDCYFPVRADVRTVPWQSESVCIHFPHWRILGIYLCQNRASSLYPLPPHGSEFHGFRRKPVFPWRNLYPGGRFFCHERFSLSSGDADSTGYRHSLLDCCVRTCNLRYRSSCNKLEALPTDSCRALYSKRETVLRHFLKRRHDPLRSVPDHSDRFAAIYVMILAPVAVACATSTSYAAVRILPEAFLWYRNGVSIP